MECDGKFSTVVRRLLERVVNNSPRHTVTLKKLEADLNTEQKKSASLEQELRTAAEALEDCKLQLSEVENRLTDEIAKSTDLSGKVTRISDQLNFFINPLSIDEKKRYSFIILIGVTSVYGLLRGSNNSTDLLNITMVSIFASFAYLMGFTAGIRDKLPEKDFKQGYIILGKWVKGVDVLLALIYGVIFGFGAWNVDSPQGLFSLAGTMVMFLLPALLRKSTP